MPAWLAIALALAVDGAAGLAGGLLSERWLRRHAAVLVSFAAGALIAAALLDALPEAMAALGGGAPAWVFGGFVAAGAFELAVGGHHHGQRRALPATLLASDALHNVGDGAALAAAFLLSPRTGLGLAVAVVAHEVPQEIGDYALLRRAGWPRRRALGALAAVQLTAAVGAAAVAVASGAAQRLAGGVIAVACGSFLYIGAADLLPELRASDARGRLFGFALGAATVIAAAALT